MRLILIFAYCIIGQTLITYAQDTRTVDADFNDLTFPQFVNRIESITHFHFYYDPAETDSIIINLRARHARLPELLDQAFKNTVFHYAIDPHDNVYITRHNAIRTTLPSAHSRDSAGGGSRDTSSVWTVADHTATKALRASLENKLIEIGIAAGQPQGNATLVGYVRDARNGEALVGAAVYLDDPPIGAITDAYGYFSLRLAKGRHVIRISSAGMKDTRRQILLHSDGKLNIEMEDFVPTLIAATVVSEKKSNIKALQMGVERINIKTINQIPPVLGEPHALKPALTLPGLPP